MSSSKHYTWVTYLSKSVFDLKAILNSCRAGSSRFLHRYLTLSRKLRESRGRSISSRLSLSPFARNLQTISARTPRRVRASSSPSTSTFNSALHYYYLLICTSELWPRVSLRLRKLHRLSRISLRWTLHPTSRSRMNCSVLSILSWPNAWRLITYVQHMVFQPCKRSLTLHPKPISRNRLTTLSTRITWKTRWTGIRLLWIKSRRGLGWVLSLARVYSNSK